jgi:hypothetical protein
VTLEGLRSELAAFTLRLRSDFEASFLPILVDCNLIAQQFRSDYEMPAQPLRCHFEVRSDLLAMGTTFAM